MPERREKAFQVVLSDIPGDGMFLVGICKLSMLSSLDLPGQWHLKHLVMLQGQLHSFACFVPNCLSDYCFPPFLLMWFEPHEQREEMLNPSQPCLGWQVASGENMEGDLSCHHHLRIWNNFPFHFL